MRKTFNEMSRPAIVVGVPTLVVEASEAHVVAGDLSPSSNVERSVATGVPMENRPQETRASLRDSVPRPS